MSFNIGGVNVFKVAAIVSAVGFAWFSFVSPETANAAVKANGCLIALFASLAAYYYSQFANERDFTEKDGMWRRFDEQERDFSYRIEQVWDEIHALKGKDCGSCKKSR